MTTIPSQKNREELIKEWEQSDAYKHSISAEIIANIHGHVPYPTSLVNTPDWWINKITQALADQRENDIEKAWKYFVEATRNESWSKEEFITTITEEKS